MNHSGNLLNIGLLMQEARKDGITTSEFYDWLLHLNSCNQYTGATFASLEFLVRIKNGSPDPNLSREEREKTIKAWCKTLANRRADLVKKGWLIKVIDQPRNELGQFQSGVKRKTTTYQIPRRLWRLSRYCSISLPPVGRMETDEYEQITHNPENGDYGKEEIQKTGNTDNTPTIPKSGNTVEPQPVIPKSGNRNPEIRDRNPEIRDAEPLLTLYKNPYILELEVIGTYVPFFTPPSDYVFSESEKVEAIRVAVRANPDSIVWQECKALAARRRVDLEERLKMWALFVFDEKGMFPIDDYKAGELRKRFLTTLDNSKPKKENSGGGLKGKTPRFLQGK